MIFLDTETCGFVGPIILIQYQIEEDSTVYVYHVWRESVSDTLQLIERIVDDDIVLFNAVFDWFHLCQLYNLFIHVVDKSSPPSVAEIAAILATSNRGGHLSLKPRSMLDLMLVVRKSKWQTLMDRDDITIKRIPFEVADLVANELHSRLEIPGIYFAKRSLGYQWQVSPSDEDNLCDISLKFGASFGLKALARQLLQADTIDYPIPKDLNPVEQGYNPYSTEWTEVIHKHIAYWQFNPNALSYATNDIIYLRRLYFHFQEPPQNDTDSALTVAVANARWEGFNVDIGAMSDRYMSNVDFLRTVPINYASPFEAKKYLLEVANPTVRTIIRGTDKDTLKLLSKLRPSYPDVAGRADLLMKARKLDKENLILHRLVTTGRFCPELKIIGTRSGRMSGGGEDSDITSLNPQGIQRNKEFRSLFPLHDNTNVLSGGDFESQEVGILAAWCNDPTLNKELGEGKSFHGIMGEALYGKSYDDVLMTKGLMTGDLYMPAKNTSFAMFYGAQIPKMASTAGIDEERMEISYHELLSKYPRVGIARAAIFDAFCSMRQPDGIGTKIFWREPADYVESLLGFRRYFTLENAIVKVIFNLAEQLPNTIQGTRKVTRSKREQTVRGATQSALFGVAFQLQAANMRAAANHVIQSTGGEITKEVQADIYQIQAQGIQPMVLKLMNVHDEIMCVHSKELDKAIQTRVNAKVESFRKLIPLIKMEWKTNLSTWGEK